MAADEKSTRDMGHLVAALDQLVGTVRRRDPAHSSHGQTAGDGTLGRRTSPCSSALFTPVDSVLLFDRADAERVPLTLELRTAPSCLRASCSAPSTFGSCPAAPRPSCSASPPSSPPFRSAGASTSRLSSLFSIFTTGPPSARAMQEAAWAA